MGSNSSRRNNRIHNSPIEVKRNTSGINIRYDMVTNSGNYWHFDEECCICLDNISNVMLWPCNHCNICHSCFEKFFNHTCDVQTQLNCPMCRKHIEKACMLRFEWLKFNGYK